MKVGIDNIDICTIGRFTGEVDSNGDEVQTVLYSGECLLEVGYASAFRYDGFQFEYEALLFVPVNDVQFKTNDVVNVTTLNGTEYSYTIKFVEPIIDSEFEELNDTCIWLKDGN